MPTIVHAGWPMTKLLELSLLFDPFLFNAPLQGVDVRCDPGSYVRVGFLGALDIGLLTVPHEDVPGKATGCKDWGDQMWPSIPQTALLRCSLEGECGLRSGL